jgi:hypothetical protein
LRTYLHASVGSSLLKSICGACGDTESSITVGIGIVRAGSKAGEVGAFAEEGGDSWTNRHASRSGGVSIRGLWTLGAKQYTVSVDGLRISVSDNSSICNSAALLFADPCLIVTESAMFLHCPRALLHAGASSVVGVVGRRTKRHAEFSSRVCKCTHASRTHVHTQISTVICPLALAIPRRLHASPRGLVPPSTRHADRHADPRTVLRVVHHQRDLGAGGQAGSIASLVAIEGGRTLIHALICGVEAEETGQDGANHHTEVLAGRNVRVVG